MKTTDQRYAIAQIRTALGLRRLDPRRLYLVNDGAYRWIGDRAELTAADARALGAICRCGSRPADATHEDRRACEAADYSAICGRVGCISATHGSAGIVESDDLPESWWDGSALGPISPL